MTDLKIGDPAPDFDLPRDGGTQIKLSDFKGQKLILYFYPKDDTPGCTTQACGFNENLKAFKSLDAAVIGISKCSVKKHDKFVAKYDLNFPLASDDNGDTCELYGVWGEKSMYGKKFMGITRTTFLIDEDGKIAHIWPNVKVKNHIEDVKSKLIA